MLYQPHVILKILLFTGLSFSLNSTSAQKTKKGSLPKGLVGKWVSGSLKDGMRTMLLGDNGQGTYTVSCDISFGEDKDCRCKYSSKTSFTWSVKKDSLILKFADIETKDGSATSSGSYERRKLCEEMTCAVIRVSIWGEVRRLKGNTVKTPYILAGNSLEWAETEFKKDE